MSSLSFAVQDLSGALEDYYAAQEKVAAITHPAHPPLSERPDVLELIAAAQTVVDSWDS